MAIIQYLTTIHFDHGAISVLVRSIMSDAATW